MLSDKIMTIDQAARWAEQLHAKGETLVVTNGCFDLLHRGHIQYLNDSASLGTHLLVAINSDRAVQELKGPTRPVVKQDDRAFMLAALECVAAVVIFDNRKPVDVFRNVRMDVYTKGGDYTEDTLDREEYAILKSWNPKFAFIPFVNGFSTSSTIKHIQTGNAANAAASAAASSADAFDSRLQPFFARRSVRAFQPRPIGDALVRQILGAAMSAPSACCKDPWHFVVLKDDAVRRAVAECLPNGGFLADAPMGFIVCGDIELAHAHELSYMLQDAAAAVENALLAITALGLGGCWLGIHPRAERVAAIQKCLNLPANIVPVAGIALGFPAQEPPARTRFQEDRIHWNGFNA